MDFQSGKSFGKLRLRAFQPYHQILCILKHVEDVEDRSNTLRAVMLCMSKTSKMGKEHTHTFWLITSLILNGFSIRKKFWKAETRAFQPYHQILCILKHVGDVEDRSNTLRAVMLCMSRVEDGKRTYTHILAHNFLNINGFSIRKKFWKAET